MPDEDKIKEIRKEMKGVKDMKMRREKFWRRSAAPRARWASSRADRCRSRRSTGTFFKFPVLRVHPAASPFEGIGLASDKNHSIANECYLYVARRLRRTRPRKPNARSSSSCTAPRALCPLSVRRVKQFAGASNYSQDQGRPMGETTTISNATA